MKETLAIWIVLWAWAYVVSVRLVYTQTLAARRSAVAVIYEPDAAVPDPLPRAATEATWPTEPDECRSVPRRVLGVRRQRGEHRQVGHDDRHQQAPGDAHARAEAAGPVYTGRPVNPDEVTGAGLQEYLLKAMPPRITPQPAAGNRLYVRGGSNAISVPLFRMGPTEPDRIEALNFRRPVSRVPDSLVEHYLHHQEKAPDGTPISPTPPGAGRSSSRSSCGLSSPTRRCSSRAWSTRCARSTITSTPSAGYPPTAGRSPAPC